jgi:branched-chain amino acid transport system ATP-binding protein
MAILLVEQNSSMVLSLADRVYIMDDGRIVYTSRAADLEANHRLKRQLLPV